MKNIFLEQILDRQLILGQNMNQNLLNLLFFYKIKKLKAKKDEINLKFTEKKPKQMKTLLKLF